MFIPTLIYIKYSRYPKKIIQNGNLTEFDKQKYAKQWDCIGKLYNKYLPIKMQPKLMFNVMGGDPITFGTGNQLYIAVFGKLITKFNKDINCFTSILLHEIGHIVNKDIKKVYLAESNWQILKLTLSLSLSIFLVSFLLISIPGYLHMFIILPFATAFNLITLDLIKTFFLVVHFFSAMFFYFLIFLIILYILRKHIIRLREFYADAKVLEWEQSPNKIIKALHEEINSLNTSLNITNNAKIKKWNFSKLYDRAKSNPITKFHPSVEERIQVLKNNSLLFVPSLWVAFTAGYFYSIIEMTTLFLKDLFSISSEEFLAMASSNSHTSFDIGVSFRALVSLIFFTVLMIAISSSFHKLALKGIFVDDLGHFPISIIYIIIRFSLIFSLGWLSFTLIDLIYYGTSSLDNDSLYYARNLISHSVYFSIVLIFLYIFSSMLIRRSFSKKEAMNNFFTITFFSSILYIFIRFIAVETLHIYPLIFVFLFIFSFIIYFFIKTKDKKLCCPNCNEKITVLSELKLSCPNCNHNLYSWAVYPFSMNPCINEDFDKSPTSTNCSVY